MAAERLEQVRHETQRTKMTTERTAAKKPGRPLPQDRKGRKNKGLLKMRFF